MNHFTSKLNRFCIFSVIRCCLRDKPGYIPRAAACREPNGGCAMIFPYAGECDRFQRNGKEAKNASAVSRAASNRRRRLCGNDLHVMILPFSHSPSVIKPSQAMRTARHHHGGRCDSYGNRYAACSSGMSVNIKKQSKQRGKPRRSYTYHHKVNPFFRRGSSFFIWEGASVYGTGKITACLYRKSAVR